MTIAFVDHIRKSPRMRLLMAHLLLLIVLPLSHVSVLGSESRAEVVPGPEILCKEWFDSDSTVQALTLSATTQAIHVVTLNDSTLGWIFRTDKTPPKCKGKHGEIILWVGLGTDGLIKGVRIIDHVEDKKHFSLLTTSGFFEQFFGRRATDHVAVVDTVTSATRSSSAIREEVLLGARHIASQPEVAKKMSNPEKKADK
jgi:Na+-translocating ferredoxin:NAD+ oxidoreductase RnfG subunit